MSRLIPKNESEYIQNSKTVSHEETQSNEDMQNVMTTMAIMEMLSRHQNSGSLCELNTNQIISLPQYVHNLNYFLVSEIITEKE